MPGLLLGRLYIVYVMIRCTLDPTLGAARAARGAGDAAAREKLALLKGLILPIMIIVWVLGSIYGGIASVTESAGVGVVGAIASAALRRELNWQHAARGAAPDDDHGRRAALADAAAPTPASASTTSWAAPATCGA